MKNEKIDTGSARTSTGYRQVAVRSMETMELCPVVYGVYSGYQTDRCHYQATMPDSIVFSCSWRRGEETFTVESADGEDLTSTAAINGWWKRLEKVHPWTMDFLKEVGRGDSLLPDEALAFQGGETLAQRNRRRKLTALVDGKFAARYQYDRVEIADQVPFPQEGVPIEEPFFKDSALVSIDQWNEFRVNGEVIAVGGISGNLLREDINAPEGATLIIIRHEAYVRTHGGMHVSHGAIIRRYSL